jgi:regulator of RNase E activity RraA
MGHYQIGDMPAAIAPVLVAKLMQVETATIGHMRHHGFMCSAIQALVPGTRIAGRAITLALPSHDSTLLHHAIGLVQAGDVLVIDRLGDKRHACWGGSVTYAARLAGVQGAIIDGPCTDPAEIRAQSFPLWASGVSALTTRIADLGGILNQPVCCGGVPVNPGDVVLADESGVVVLDPRDAEAIAATALARQAASVDRRKRLDAGARLGDLSGASPLVIASLKSSNR